MAITNTLYEIGYTSAQIGTLYQRMPQSTPGIWMAMRMGNVTQTDTTYTFTINGRFKYYGWENIIFTELGYWIMNSNNVEMSNGHQSVYKTTEADTAQITQEGMWIQDCTWTVNKTDYPSVLVPYFKIGGMTYQEASINGEAWWWGNGYGCLTWYYSGSYSNPTINSAYNAWNIDATFKGKTRSIRAATITVTKDHGSNRNYSNGLINLQKKSPITVYDASGKPHKASKITVYDASGKPHTAKNITIYDASGKPHTMPC